MADKPTVAQQRSDQRAAKVAALKHKEQRERRNRILLTTTISVVAVAAVVAIVFVVVTGGTPKTNPTAGPISGLKTWSNLEQTHVTDSVDYKALYDMDPPAGGKHDATWLNCGIYTEPQRSENAVHVLEHGGVWITYDPARVSGADLTTLQEATPDTYAVLSPYPGLPAPVVASAWGAQVQLDGVDDPNLANFIGTYWKAQTAPEPGAPCTGGIDGPGKL